MTETDRESQKNRKAQIEREEGTARNRDIAIQKERDRFR